MSTDDENASTVWVGTLVDISESAVFRWWTGGQRHDLQAHPLDRSWDGRWIPGQDPDTGAWHIGLEWGEPRNISGVSVEYAKDPPPAPSEVTLQYWRKNWPTPAPERRPGARRGWIGQDDPWHGQWVKVRSARSRLGRSIEFAFDPVDLLELGGRSAVEQLDGAEDYLASFRRTLKLRLVHVCENAPLVDRVKVTTGACWREASADIYFGVKEHGSAAAEWSGRATAVNGHILTVQTLPQGPVQKGDRWLFLPGEEKCRLRLSILCTDAASGTGDETIISIETQSRTFSFRVADVQRGPVHIPDYDVLIAWADDALSAREVLNQSEQTPGAIYDRVSDEASTGRGEQTLQWASAVVPALVVRVHEPYGRYFPLGVEAGRQEFALRYNGELFANKADLKLSGRDAARLLWPSHEIRFRFGTGDPPDFREGTLSTQQSLLDGWLPVVISRWLDREIEYEQVAYATLVDGSMTSVEDRRGDEDIVVMLRFVVRNTTHGPKRASLWVSIAPQEQLELRDGAVVALGRVVPDVPVARQWRVDSYREPLLRCMIGGDDLAHGAAVPYTDQAAPSAVANGAVVLRLDLEGHETASVTLGVPFVSLQDTQDWERVRALDFDQCLENSTRYWREYIDRGGAIEVPDKILSDFTKAVRTHIAVSVDKDPESGLIVVPAGTWRYGACGNEACWQITMLDQLGHHERAEAYLETFLRTQGVAMLDGRFGSAEGTLQAFDLDEGAPMPTRFGYNLDHGYIMECLVNHYRLTGDSAWLERVIPHLIEACDFITRERAGAKETGPDGRRTSGWGLLPVGHLEDNEDWRQWFAVNAHACGGMRATAHVLNEMEHPDGPRIDHEAQSYKDDIRAAATRAMQDAPVVQLRDGTYVPHTPARVGIRGREMGWFREVAYGAIQLLEGNVLEPIDPQITWVLEDMEDNLFVSREWGYPIDLETDWFSLGGITPQPNLMDLAVDYLRRGEVSHALRAFFNTWAASIYPDVLCFAEWVPSYGVGGGPFFKTPDEARWVTWLRALLLLDGDRTLKVGAGMPRYWLEDGQRVRFERLATRFGPVSCTWTSHMRDGHVDIDYSPPSRVEPERTALYVRCPDRGRAVARVDCTMAEVRVVDASTGELSFHGSPDPTSIRVSFDDRSV